ncbi:MAG: sulfite exporter TauE/SafE family protein, partial [Armatimonadota bacterium]
CIIFLILNGLMRGLPVWSLALPLCAGAVLSVPLAAYTVKLMPPQMLRGSIAYVTVFLGCLTLVKVLLVH